MYIPRFREGRVVKVGACKDFAAECLRLSQRAKTAEHRAILIGMAETWERMARDIEEQEAVKQNGK